MMHKALLLLLLPINVFSLKCHLCDSFDGYCDFDQRTCVGSRCAKRSVILDNGMIRIQKFCQSSDAVPGCHAAILWQGLPGEECICDSDLCNNTSIVQFPLIFFVIFLYYVLNNL